MPLLVKRNASFVIRIWWERRNDQPVVWRGQIIHVQTGQTVFFQRAGALVDFIRCWSGVVTTEEGNSNDEL